MFKKFSFFLLTTMASVFIFVASIGAQTNCFLGSYQPKLPKALRKY